MTEELALAVEPPIAGSELETLLGSLDRTRRTLAWKAGDLGAAAMATRIGASTMTLGGLVRHLTTVETASFAFKLHDLDVEIGPERWAADWEWTGTEDVDDVWRRWRAAVAESKRLVDAAVADGGLDRAAGHRFEGWGTPSLRRILIDTIEEYARHTGHADLIRETIDGRVGEDAP